MHDGIRQFLDAGMTDTCEAPQDIVLLATLLGLPQSDLDAVQSAAATARVAARPRPVAETELARTAVLANRWTSPP
jgi:hypothetical protein